MSAVIVSPPQPAAPPRVCVLGVSSGIGSAVARRYLDMGRSVVGIYRDRDRVADLEPETRSGRLHLVRCDLSEDGGAQALGEFFKQTGLCWDLLFSSVGTMRPIGPFFATDFRQWSGSLQVNAVRQLEAVHALYPLRVREAPATVVFLAGAGTNGPAVNYSAYCLSKIMLIKMCELLHAEAEDIKAVIIGPGWVRTRIHDETLASGSLAGENLERTRRFVEGAAPGTDMDAIFDCIRWVERQPRDIVGGRNFSVAHDDWRGEDEAALAMALTQDQDMYKLRRHKNEKSTWLRPRS